MDFGLLGPLEVRGDHGPLPLGERKQRALLGLLLLHPNRVLARTQLIDELWGDPPVTAAKAVQVYVSRLRKLLPDGTLLTRPPGYLLAVEPEAIDLQRFERLVAAARSVDPARASGLLQNALSLWRGVPLAEFADEPFARVESARLRDLRLVALEQWIEAELALGRHAELVGELESLVAEEPHRERFRGQLMLALYRSGRQAEALAAYRAAWNALDELGIEPSERLRLLEKQILGQDAALDQRRRRLLSTGAADRGPLPGLLVPAPAFPFVGRAAEMTTLRSLFERAEGGEGGVVLLAGEAGAGKTRLVRELAHEAAARGVLVLYGASDAAVSSPYEPIRQWFEFLVPACDADVLRECLGGRGEQVSRLVPELASLTAASARPSAVDQPDRFVLQGAVTDLLKRIGRLQPLLLVLEDVHWADGETLQLLRRLGRAAPEAPMLVIGTFRHRGEEIGEELSGTLADLSRLDGVTRLAVGNLSREDIGAFIRASAESDATEELAGALGELTNGTPLLLCELWRDMVETGAVEVSHARVRLARPPEGLRGRERINDIVRQRLSRLSHEAVVILELGAVAGPRFELQVLSEASGFDPDTLVATVEEAVRHGMLEELPELAPACTFTHELVRRAVYDRIRRVRRPELHLRVGRALEHIHSADPRRVLPELAHHFTLAAPVCGSGPGVDYNLRAAEAAMGSLAFGEAAAGLSRALELGMSDPHEQARVQVELGYLLYKTGKSSESEAILTASLDAATALEERGLAARALVHRASLRMNTDAGADLEQVLPVAESAIETFTELGDSVGLAQAEGLLGFALRSRGRLTASCAALERALVHAAASGDHTTRGHVLAQLGGSICEGPIPVSVAIPRCRALLDSSGGDRGLEAEISRYLGLLFTMAARFDEAREQLQKTSIVYDELNRYGTSRRTVAEAKEFAGDIDGARQELAEMWRHYRDAGGGRSDTRALGAAWRLALLYCDEGRWAEAADCLAYGRDVPEPADFRPSTVLRLAADARVAAHDGKIAEALRLAGRAVELAGRGEMLNLTARVYLAYAEVHRRCGDTAAAGAARVTALRLYEAKGNIAAATRLLDPMADV